MNNIALVDLKEALSGGKISKHEYIERMHQHHSQMFAYASFIKDSEITAIELANGRVTMTTRAGVKLACDTQDKRTAPVEALNFGNYEAQFVETVCSLIPDTGVVLDIGANIGWYSLHIAKRYPNVDIHSFEPIPSTYAKLTENVVLNALSQIKTHDYGLSNVDEIQTFYFEPACSGRASGKNLGDVTDIQKLECRVRRLDDIREFSHKEVKFIKCDCEGAELFVFQGGGGLLKASKPIVFCEMLRKWSAKFGYHPNDIINYMKQFSYSCFALRKDQLELVNFVDECTVDTNFFFFDIEKHRDRLKRASLIAKIN